MRKITEKGILKRLLSGEFNSEQALESLSSIGASPSLIHDDNGHWAISSMGFQNVPLTDEPEDITTTLFVEAKAWKNTIREAIIYWLESDE